MSHRLDLGRSCLFSSAVIEWIRGKGPVLIVTHNNPDPDSLASATALRHLLLVLLGVESVIAFGGKIGRSENRCMVEMLEIAAVPLEGLDLDQFQVVCMVDTQPGTGNNAFPLDREVHVVIDHHPLKPLTHNARWVDVREGYGASATMLYEYLVCQNVYLATRMATVLFYAIKSETQDLGREWIKADRQAYLALVPLANNKVLYEITHPEAPREYFRVFGAAINSAMVYGRALVFNLEDVDNPDMVSELADFLLRVEGIDTVLGVARFRGEGVVSLRTRDHTLRAGLAVQRLLKGLGTAGGHGLIAGGQVHNLPEGQQAMDDLVAKLTRRLLDVLNVEDHVGNLLVASEATPAFD
ncbi:MAG: phosphoesterase [Desulfuromonas sp.]|nr:MAG: phosphoesterase [Desulfuromonas sp.]